MKYILFLSVIFFAFVSEASVGQKGLALSTSYWSWTIESENSALNQQRNSVSTALMLAKLNYALSSGFFFGATMFRAKDSVSSNKLFGPNIGFNFKGFSLGLTYYINPKEKENEFIEYQDGQVISAELGYHVNVTKYFVIGVNLTYLRRDYDKVIFIGTEIPTTAKSDQYYPLLSFGFVWDPSPSDGYELEGSF